MSSGSGEQVNEMNSIIDSPSGTQLLNCSPAPLSRRSRMVRGLWFVVGGVVSGQWPVASEKTAAPAVRASLTPDPWPLTPRHGITLLEVLISMFVLAVGLLGVAAMIPAGRHEVAQGSRLDHAAAVGRAAFRDLQVRGFLKPFDAATGKSWEDPAGTSVWSGDPANPFLDSGGNPTPQAAYAIDPLGILTTPSHTKIFPFSANTAQPHLTRIFPIVNTSGAITPAYWDSIFRATADLSMEANASNADLPPNQLWFKSGTNELRRASQGDYSWLATIVSDPSRPGTSGKVTVSVAVFHKRNPLPYTDSNGNGAYDTNEPLGGEGSGQPIFASGVAGGQLGLSNLSKAVRPGQWVMLAGRRVVGTVNLDYFRWYRVLSAQQPSGAAPAMTQKTVVAGMDWDTSLANPLVFVFENVVAVYEKNLALEQ